MATRRPAREGHAARATSRAARPRARTARSSAIANTVHVESRDGVVGVDRRPAQRGRADEVRAQVIAEQGIRRRPAPAADSPWSARGRGPRGRRCRRRRAGRAGTRRSRPRGSTGTGSRPGGRRGPARVRSPRAATVRAPPRRDLARRAPRWPAARRRGRARRGRSRAKANTRPRPKAIPSGSTSAGSTATPAHLWSPRPGPTSAISRKAAYRAVAANMLKACRLCGRRRRAIIGDARAGCQATRRAPKLARFQGLQGKVRCVTMGAC